MTIRGGGDPRQAWLARRLREWACRLGALPPMRMTASWSGSASDPPNTSVWRDRSRQWRAPLGSSPSPLPAGSDAGASRKARLPVHPPSACSGVKALRNKSFARAASRQATLAFRSLDPLRALREPDRRRRDEERPFPLRTKNRLQTKNDYLTGKAPYRFESTFLQRRACEPLVPPSAEGLLIGGLVGTTTKKWERRGGPRDAMRAMLG